jgi:transposase
LFVRASLKEAGMNVRYRVELNQVERTELKALLSGGKHASRKLKRAQILLAADVGAGDEEIARSVGVGGSTVYRTKRRFVEGNLERALSEEPRPGAERKLTGKEEALLVATACASPPKGRSRWTLKLLAGAIVKLTDHTSLSHETVRRRLAENDLKPWRKDMWCIPQVDGEYVARMEDVLDLYAEAPDPKRPVVCFDESPVQLIGEVRQPIPARSGRLERYDYEYRRNGTVNLFVLLDVHRPWRKVKLTERRAAKDYAKCMRDLVDIHCPDAETIQVVRRCWPPERQELPNPLRRGDECHRARMSKQVCVSFLEGRWSLVMSSWGKIGFRQLGIDPTTLSGSHSRGAGRAPVALNSAQMPAKVASGRSSLIANQNTSCSWSPDWARARIQL